VKVSLSAGGQVDPKVFITDLTKEGRKNRKVGAAFRLALGIMDDSRLWLQVRGFNDRNIRTRKQSFLVDRTCGHRGNIKSEKMLHQRQVERKNSTGKAQLNRTK